MMFGPSKPQQPTNSTADTIRLRDAYLQHQMQAQESGQKPLPYDQWLAQQQAQQPKK